MAIGGYCIGYSILPALEVHLLQTKLHALLSGAGLSTLLDLNKATLPPPHYCSVPTSVSSWWSITLSKLQAASQLGAEGRQFFWT